jgi:hypothetical protein
MDLKMSFNHWLNVTLKNMQRRNFNEIQQELESEIRFAELNGDDPLEWCKGCQLGICETHFNPELQFFIHDDSYGIEN